MTDRFTDMLRQKLTVKWGEEIGPLDMRNHSTGIGGVHSMPAPKNVIEPIAALKPRLIRIFLQEFFFIYPDHGVFDWKKMDAYMDAVHAMGGDIMATICIKPKPLYPVVDESIWMPNNVEEWQDVVRALVLRYTKEKPYVTYWAITNEQNIGEYGGCPFLIKNPDDYFEYYKLTAAPIREVLPDVKVGGPHYAGLSGSADYLERFVELCTKENVKVDFTCYNMYSNSPKEHSEGARAIRNALDKWNKDIELYITELNIGIGEEVSLEEKAYDPKRAAGLAATILAFHEDGALNGTFQYHTYDQWNDPREFEPFYSIHRYMAHHWNDQPHRLGLINLDGKVKPQYFVYKLLYDLTGKRVVLNGTNNILQGLASRGECGALSIFLVNYAEKGTPDCIARYQFEDAPAGVYRMNVYKIDEITTAAMKAVCTRELLPSESRVVYVHPDFQFDVYIPGDTVALVQFVNED